MTGVSPRTPGDRVRELRAAIGPLLRRLGGAAVDGVVPRDAFLAATSPLGLDAASLSRVEEVLGEIGLRVAPPPRPPTPARAAGGRAGTAHRVPAAEALALRYRTPQGIPAHAVAGIARLCGLTAAEERRLRAALPVMPALPGHGRGGGPAARPPATPDRGAIGPPESRHRTDAPGAPAGDQAAGTPPSAPPPARGARRPAAPRTTGPPPADPSPAHRPPDGPPPGVTAPPVVRLAGAVPGARVPNPRAPEPSPPPDRERCLRRAHALLAERRSAARRARRLLDHEEVVGLLLLMRGGTDDGWRRVDGAELAALPGDDPCRGAFEAMIEHNLGLVGEVARRWNTRTLTQEDLVQDGVVGLIHAVCRYRPDRGARFSTYAYQWIAQAVGRAVDDRDAAIRLPLHVHARLRRRPPEEREVPVVADSLDRVTADGRVVAECLDHLTPVPGPEEVLAARWEREDIEQRLFSRVTPRQADIVRRRIGLVDQERSTLEEIGQDYGLTRERIRQLEKKALTRIAEVLHERSADPGGDDFAGVVGRIVRSLGRDELRRAAGAGGAQILLAIAEHRLPPAAASARLRRVVAELGRRPRPSSRARTTAGRRPGGRARQAGGPGPARARTPPGPAAPDTPGPGGA